MRGLWAIPACLALLGTLWLLWVLLRLDSLTSWPRGFVAPMLGAFGCLAVFAVCMSLATS